MTEAQESLNTPPPPAYTQPVTEELLSKDNPITKLAMELMEAAERFREAFPGQAAVRWLEDTSGRLIVFTRGEYKEAIRKAIAQNLQPEQVFEEIEVEREGWEKE
jgi:hypothetical protein